MKKLPFFVLFSALILTGGLASAFEFTADNIISVSSGATYEVDTLANGVKTFIDRDYIFVDNDEATNFLLGMHFIRGANNDRDETVDDYLVFTVPDACTVFVCVDKRANSGAGDANWAPGFIQNDTTWILAKDVNLTFGTAPGNIDGGCPMTVYYKEFTEGQTITLGGYNRGVTGGGANYTVVINDDITLNRTPFVQGAFGTGLPGTPITLDASVFNADPQGQPDALTMTWSIVSQPEGSTLTFDDTTIEDPTVTADTEGDYELLLSVDDGYGATAEATSVVRIKEPFQVEIISVANGKPYEVGVFNNGVTAYIDRTYIFHSNPQTIDNLLLGLPFIRTANDDKYSEDDPLVVLEAYGACTVYLALDKRQWNDMTHWAPAFIEDDFGANGWSEDTGLSVTFGGYPGVDGACPMRILKKDFDAGLIELGGARQGAYDTGNGGNYIILIDGIQDPTYNGTPIAKIGNVSGMVNEPMTIDAVVTNYDAEGDPDILTYSWEVLTQPEGATVTWTTGADVEDPTVTVDMVGTYEFMLTLDDGYGKTATATATALVDTREGRALLGHWPLQGDLLDVSGNGNDGTYYEGDGNAAVPVFSDDAPFFTDAALQLVNVTGAADPHFVDLGAATALDPVTVPSQFTVTAWIKTTTSGYKQNILSKGGDGGGGIRFLLKIEDTGVAKLLCDDDNHKKELRGSTNVTDGKWHFLAGTLDSLEMRLYVDGALDGTLGLGDDVNTYDLTGTGQTNGYIGTGIASDGSLGGVHLEKVLNGLVCDIRVYNFPLPLTDAPGYDSITSLYLMEPEGTMFIRGDANGSGSIDLSDAITVLGYLFGTPEDAGKVNVPKCFDAADGNDDGKIDLSDAIKILDYLFGTGQLMPLPGPADCGLDETTDSDTLECEEYSNCPE